ncbi:MAG TPA: tetratricopeptide repeat protein [Geobacterales bacterium]|nr:tetratricopeptide repeat protein [Geobacterales bacterium]
MFISPRLIIPLLFTLLFAGCASQKDLNFVVSDMDELKSRLFKAEKELVSLKSETKGSVEGSLSQIHADIAALRRSSADLQANQDSLRLDQQSTAGKMDDLKLASQRPAENLALLRDEVRQRLTAIEDRLTKMEKELANQGSERAKVPPTAKSPEELYQEGVELVHKGETVKGRELLTDFLDHNPRHDQASTARFWIAEANFADKNYDQAILDYQEVISAKGSKEKVPAAMLKQGMAFQKINDQKSAAFIWKRLVEGFPKAPEAKKAKELLKKIK